MKHDTKAILILLTLLVSLAPASAIEVDYSSASGGSIPSSSYIKILHMKYEPYPVNPGEYFDIWIKAENIGNSPTEDATFELVPEYPFSLDLNEDAVKTYGKIGYTNPVIFKYKVRVDENAAEGTNELKLRFNSIGKNAAWSEKIFEIEVENAQTDFEIISQESTTAGEVSLAIVNTGDNPGYSTIVKIPEQENIRVTGTSANVVGNLDAGDYTLVSFTVSSKMSAAAGGFDRSSFTKMTEEERQQMREEIQGQTLAGENTIKVTIDYTDTIGERRSITQEVPVTFISAAAAPTDMAARFGRTSQTSKWKTYAYWAVGLAVMASGWAYRFYEKKKKK